MSLYSRMASVLKLSKPRMIQKKLEAWQSRRPPLAPVFSFVIQTHNKAEQVKSLVLGLREVPHSEILVLDDGSQLKQSYDLLSFLSRGNEFLLRTNDLYEVITYDRALTYSRGKYVALLQDDTHFLNDQWIGDAQKLFEKHPRLAILGGRNGLNLTAPDCTLDQRRGDYEETAEYIQRKNSYKGYFAGTQGSTSHMNFRFVQTVNRAPMWFRRSAFLETLKYIDQSFAPFQWDDAEICLRAWSLGLEVGWYSVKQAEFEGVQGGMRIWNQELHHVQDEKNARRLYELWGERMSQIQMTVDAKNKELGDS